MARIDMLPGNLKPVDLPVIEAVLGKTPKSEVMVSGAIDEFYIETSDRHVGMSQDQLSKHRNLRVKAPNEFISVVGDKALCDVNSEDMVAFRRHLMKRGGAGEISADTANKQIAALVATWKPVAYAHAFKLGFERDGLRVTAGKMVTQKTRPPFSDAWIRARLWHRHLWPVRG